MWPRRVGGGGGVTLSGVSWGFGEPPSCSRQGWGGQDPPGKLTVGDVDAGRNAGAGEDGTSREVKSG